MMRKMMMMMRCFLSLIPAPLLSLSPPSTDRHVLVGSRHDNDRGGGASAIMNQLIAALTEQTKHGWVPDRTAVFCSWGGTALGNIGSYEWGKVSGSPGAIQTENSLPPAHPAGPPGRSENHGLRFGGAESHPSRYTLGCKPPQHTMEVLAR